MIGAMIAGSHALVLIWTDCAKRYCGRSTAKMREIVEVNPQSAAAQL